MNWDDIRLFLAVARTGSISGAARQLEVQHSTVSRRMRQLETKLGARLIERKKSGYELTPAGDKLKQAALRMENEVIGIDETLLGKDIKLVGPLKVTAINNMASTVLMPMFAEFSKQNPQVDLHIMVSNSDASLTEREADIAIRMTNTPTDTLVGKRMVTVASTLYGSREYLTQLKQSGASPKWIGVNCCAFHKSWTRQNSDTHSFEFYSDDTLLTLAAIKQGLGISYLPCFMGDSDAQLQRHCDPDPEHNLGLWILLHADLKRTARVLAFRDFITQAVQQKRDLFEGNLVQATQT
jgi:molybdate transport repressor ModE-like protein